MVRQNLHCHTCFDDGADAPERMVLAAEAAGLDSLGISLHCPIPGQDDWCCPEADEPRFLREMRRLREKYAERLPVYCGLEYDLDAAPRFAPYDYVIASCHNLAGLSLDYTPEQAAALVDRFGGADRAAEAYYHRVREIAALAGAQIVGHFDLLLKFNERFPLYDTASRAYRDAAHAALEALNAAGKIFEINTGAISRGWRRDPYPEPALLRRLHSLGGRICISSDAHRAEHVAFGFAEAEALAAACGFRELWQFDGERFIPVPL